MPNYDESKVPHFTLPSILHYGGMNVTTASQWVNQGRARILELYRKEVFGRWLPRPDRIGFETLSRRDDALEGRAIRKEIRIILAMNDGRTHCANMLLYVPKNAQEPPPVFVSCCFKGYHAITDEKDVLLSGGNWSANPDFKDEMRGTFARRGAFREIVDRGYASAAVCLHDWFPDHPAGWGESALNLFGDFSKMEGTHEEYTAIGTWAWGLSRMLDVLECEPLVDASRAMVCGHSRLGKTALWAGANDPRFRMVISNDSGCCGAALSKRCFGETVDIITGGFPHWFVKAFHKYRNNEAALPFDQHFLLSLAAPRPLCIASAAEDLWADPKGEFLAAYYAGEVYQLFGSEGLGLAKPEPPAVDVFHTADISYHNRSGKHDITPVDWKHYMDAADRLWNR